MKKHSKVITKVEAEGQDTVELTENRRALFKTDIHHITLCKDRKLL